MISVAEHTYRFESRPTVNVPWWKRCIVFFGLPAFRWWNSVRHRKKEAALEQIMRLASRCIDRQELEGILGKPKYALDGQLFTITLPSGESCQPDIVEVYSVAGCTFDVLFFVDEERYEVFGAVTSTSVDVILQDFRHTT